jgi:hypothetical protein
MIDNPQIHKLQSIFKNKYLAFNANELVENDIDSKGNPFTMKRSIVGEPGSIEYVVFRVDPNEVILFPYFAEVKGLNKICDFIIFAETNTDFLILLIEMKKHSGSPEKQLELSLPFVNFVLERAKLIDIEIEKNIIIRKLGIKDSRISQKETTKYYKDFHFDNNYYSLELGGRQIRLKQIIEAPIY